MGAWLECIHCQGRGSIPTECNEQPMYSYSILERITGRRSCPRCNGEGKILIE
nr:MAG TPA: chaperone protein [Caudoviricetes sp.]